MGKKSADHCKDRIEKLLKSNLKGAWTAEEDNLITKYSEKYGRNWALIATKVKGRSGK